MIEPAHLQSDEAEDEAKAVLEIMEFRDHPREDKVQCPESQNREDIRCENNERFLRDGKDGRDAIDCKDDVRDLNEEQGDKKRRAKPTSFMPEQKGPAMELRRDGKHPFE